MKLHELALDPPPLNEKEETSTLSQGGTISIMEHGVRKVYSMDEYFKSKGLPPLRRARVDDHLGAVED